MTIDVTHDTTRSAVSDLRTVADQLAADRGRIAREVDVLLDGGWSGMAAESFAEAWQDWLRASHEVRDGLTAMASLVQAVHRDLLAQDLGSRTRMEEISGRILARLG